MGGQLVLTDFSSFFLRLCKALSELPPSTAVPQNCLPNHCLSLGWQLEALALLRLAAPP